MLALSQILALFVTFRDNSDISRKYFPSIRIKKKLDWGSYTHTLGNFWQQRNIFWPMGPLYGVMQHSTGWSKKNGATLHFPKYL